MKYFLALIFILFFGLSSFAQNCPPEKPLQDTKGNCYSCNDERTFVHLNDGIGVVESNEVQYNGECEKLCPNRLSYSDGWLEAPRYCVLNTFKNRIVAHLVNNMMYILFYPLNWINFFLLLIMISFVLAKILKKYENRLMKNVIRVFSVLLSLLLTLTFLNDLIITIFGIVSVVWIKISHLKKIEIKAFGKSFRRFVKMIFLTLAILIFFSCMMLAVEILLSDVSVN